MADLLQKMPMATISNKKVPFMIEIPVSAESAPFLVTGTKKLLWIEATRTGTIRSAVRTGVFKEDLFEDVVKEVAKLGVTRKWANGFPFTARGLKQAIAYVTLYGIEKVEILSRETMGELEVPKGVTVIPAPWMPLGRAVVVPEDRAYLGLVGVLGESHWTAVVHNPSRGMAVLGAW